MTELFSTPAVVPPAEEISKDKLALRVIKSVVSLSMFSASPTAVQPVIESKLPMVTLWSSTSVLRND